MDAKLIVQGICTRCGSVSVYDAITDKVKYVPDFKWLNDRGYPYKVDDNFMYHYVSCNACAYHWRVDYCSCGSGEPYDECHCGIKDPCYFFYEPEEYLV